MFGQITDLPALASYDEALAHYNMIIPLRGTQLRPICNTPNGRRKKHMHITRTRAGAIECGLYSTAVVTFYPNGAVHLNNGSYPTVTTHDFASKICWRYASLREKGGRSVLSVGRREIEMDNQVDTVIRNRGACWEAVDIPLNIRYYVRRGVLQEKRKPIKQFQREVLALSKFTDAASVDNASPEERVLRASLSDSVESGLRLHGDTGHIFSPLESYAIMQSPAHPHYGELLLAVLDFSVVRIAARNYWSGQAVLTKPATSFISRKLVRDYISDTIKYAFADEVFERRETEKLSVNHNGKYMEKFNETNAS